jgi:hypothetical protein
MNKFCNRILRYSVLAAVVVAGMAGAATSHAQNKKTSAGEEFFIVASVDQAKSQILLKRPSEITMLMKANDKTQYADDAGKPMTLSDFRAGDTVWVLSSNPAEPTASRIRKGQMTVADLHRYYLNYPEIK